MPNTPRFNLAYPGPGDAPNGFGQVEALAESVEAAFVSLTKAPGPYKPVFSGSNTGGTNSLGTGGSLAGRYGIDPLGMIDWSVRMQTGPDFSGPIGNYRISLPVPAFCWTGGNVLIGSAMFLGGDNIMGGCMADAAVGGTAFQFGFDGSPGNAQTGNPVDWKSRVVLFWGRYEPLTPS